MPNVEESRLIMQAMQREPRVVMRRRAPQSSAPNDLLLMYCTFLLRHGFQAFDNVCADA